jgi:hypothetical protein
VVDLPRRRRPVSFEGLPQRDKPRCAERLALDPGEQVGEDVEVVRPALQRLEDHEDPAPPEGEEGRVEHQAEQERARTDVEGEPGDQRPEGISSQHRRHEPCPRRERPRRRVAPGDEPGQVGPLGQVLAEQGEVLAQFEPVAQVGDGALPITKDVRLSRREQPAG